MYIQILSAFVSLFLLCGDTSQADHGSSTYELLKTFEQGLPANHPPDQQIMAQQAVFQLKTSIYTPYRMAILLSRSTFAVYSVYQSTNLIISQQLMVSICSIGGNLE